MASTGVTADPIPPKIRYASESNPALAKSIRGVTKSTIDFQECPHIDKAWSHMRKRLRKMAASWPNNTDRTSLPDNFGLYTFSFL